MNQSDLIDTSHAARILGFHLCSVRRWLIQGKLPGRKIFGRWRAYRPAVEALVKLNKQGVQVPDVPEQKADDYPAWVDAVLKKHGVI